MNRATANLWCGVYADDGTRFRHNGEDVTLEGVADGLVAGPQRLFHDGDRLRFVLDGDDCRMDLEIVDDPGSVTFADAKAFTGASGATGTIFSSNFHASCRVRGEVALAGRTARVDAPAWRDHSWGVRHWDSFLTSRSFGGACGPWELRYASMLGATGNFMRFGSLTRAGAKVDVASAEMLVHVDDDGLRCPSAEVRYHLATGSDLVARIETIGGMIGATRERFGWESVGDVWVEGEARGWGFLEVNNNPRNGREPPVFALAAALSNGVIRPEA